MRTWGRVPVDPAMQSGGGSGSVTVGTPGWPYQWVEVDTDENGYNDAVWLTTLAQVLQLGLNESPIFGNYGIPAQQSVLTQVLPDYYVTVTQQNFAAFFLALIISRQLATEPTYQVNLTANPGAVLMSPVPI